MVIYTGLIMGLLLTWQAAGQDKPLIDTGMLGRWPYISPSDGQVALSKNGRYVAYIVLNLPVGQATLAVQDLRTGWKKITIVGMTARILFFSGDSRKLCWQINDSIWLQNTGSEQCMLLGVSKEVSYPPDAKGEWIAFPVKKDTVFRLISLVSGKSLTVTSIIKHTWTARGNNILLTTKGDVLICLNLVTGKGSFIQDAKDYALASAGESMVYMTEKGNARGLQWVDFSKSCPVTIWVGEAGELPGGYVYDKTGHQLAFHVRSADGGTSVWYYRRGTPRALLRAADSSTGFDSELRIAGPQSFTDNGQWLLFNVRKKRSTLQPERVVTQVDIWSYRDETLNPAETRGLKAIQGYMAAVPVNGGGIQLLEQAEDERFLFSRGDVLLLKKGGDEVRAVHNWWPHGELESTWLLSLEEGRRTLVIKNLAGKFRVGVLCSPTGRWIYYWEPERRQYFIVDPKTGNTFNLTGNLPVTMDDEVPQGIYPSPVGLAGWLPGDSLVLIYDNYDIWQLDPAVRKVPVNVTGGYGKQQGIKLRVLESYKDHLPPNAELLLVGYNVNTKFNGFFRLRLDKPGLPELLTMGPYTYYQEIIPDHAFNYGMRPLVGGKGKNRRWILMRQSATEYPNLYVSRDLKQFTPLTDFQPQKKYNWLTAGPVRWKMYNGQWSSGVLYKPENFDSTKKYPVIFNYYEKLSHRCYQFSMPGLTTANINIPWFVSRGYLVFTPDIQYSVAGKPGGMTISEAAFNAVASAAEYLAQRPYVDKGRMAIQGHSFGGHETNGIITQTGLFAAAAEGAGYSDHISAYLTLVSGGSREGGIEREHKLDHFNQRMGATPWERPELFRRNSPVLQADKVTTPLLIFHNRKDGSVNFRQGIEMYMALRRLGKPCWLLQYDSSGHSLSNKLDALDYTIRLTQYFDHYLKRMPAPQWMTGNTLAPYKGRNNLYDWDPGSNCSKECKVCSVKYFVLPQIILPF